MLHSSRKRLDSSAIFGRRVDAILDEDQSVTAGVKELSCRYTNAYIQQSNLIACLKEPRRWRKDETATKPVEFPCGDDDGRI